MVNNKTQIQQVQEHLEAGFPITPAKAMAEYNVWRLAALIHKLRLRGLNIVTYNKRAMNGKTYAEYVLEPARETVVWESSEDQKSIFGLHHYTEKSLQEGDVVKVVGNNSDNPAGLHCLVVPSIAIVTEIMYDRIQVQGVSDGDRMTPIQFLVPEDLVKVADYTGLKIKVDEHPPCKVCAMCAGETGVIERVRKHPPRGIHYVMEDCSPRYAVCQDSSRVVPQTL